MDTKSIDEPGFLGRFIELRGESPHHLTFIVPDVEKTIDKVRGLGLSVVKIDLSNSGWREAFIMPDRVHGVVIQIADTDRPAPDLSALISSDRTPVEFPFHHLGTQRGWWEPYVHPPRRRARLVSTVLRTTDLDLSKRLFGTVLSAQTQDESATAAAFLWRRGQLKVEVDVNPGISHLVIENGPNDQFKIAAAQFLR
ncbi:hypothetical protein AB4089_21965 [Arthrobacter sp. 2MCAF15]|uniref:hypothetical protein n=1 Tax=Arthrobacter sp. 2MCAF15 TaxID=3232984 RepID=UPI003F9336C9